MQKFNFTNSLLIISMLQWFTMNPIASISQQQLTFDVMFGSNVPLITIIFYSNSTYANSYNSFLLNILITNPKKLVPNLVYQQTYPIYVTSSTFTANLGIPTMFGDVAYDNKCFFTNKYFAMINLGTNHQVYLYFTFNSTNQTQITEI